jgi:hypothetical protein
MRTEKQIQLLREQKGGELAAKSENLDSITAKFEDSANWFPNIKDSDVLTYIPILKNGVFIADYNDFQERFIFDVEVSENMLILKAEIFDNFYKKWLWKCSIACEIPVTCNRNLKLVITDYSDATLVIFNRQKRKLEELTAYKDNVVPQAGQCLNFFFRATTWINWLLEHPEIKEVERKGRKSRKAKSSQDENIKNVDNVVKEIKINNIKFKVSNNKTANAIKSKKPRRLAGCWEVRGHFRHYQSGKVVYIKPYEKGENRAKRIKKQYTL